MNKKLQLFCVAAVLLFSVKMNADDVTRINNLNLLNPDVRKCLLETSKHEGWELKSTYMNADDKLVYVFSKGNDDKIYTSK